MSKTNIALLICGSLLGAPSVPAATLTAADLQPNDIVVTEYLANPVGVSDAQGEYFEIFNTTTDTIELGGTAVRDDGSNEFTIDSLTIAPLSFAILSSADGSALGIAPDYIYGSAMALTNADDEIALYRPDNLLINKVAYDDGDFFGAGVAHELAILDTSTPAVTSGPAAGSDFVAAVDALVADNFGSPGSAGGTVVNLPVVPVPATVWLFGGALAALGWLRRSSIR